jgi:sugar lactone lactonase YvrE
VDRKGRATAFASLPPSVAAFHLAVGRERALYVTGPTLSTCDVVYRIDEQGTVGIHSQVFGRPQGLAFDAAGTLFVVEALAGASGVYRLGAGEPELVLAGPGLVGLAFDAHGGLVVCTNDTAFRLPGSI